MSIRNVEVILRNTYNVNECAYEYGKWLDTFSDYLDRETSFDPLTETLKYDAGVILSVELGYNAKSEHGGRHYAVVVEDNSKTSNTVMVIPLGSEKPGTKVNWNDVDLGVIEEINKLTGETGVKSIAKISHMRSISKMRIVKPVTADQKLIILEPYLLKKIYAKINQRFTSKGLNRVGKVNNVVVKAKKIKKSYKKLRKANRRY